MKKAYFSAVFIIFLLTSCVYDSVDCGDMDGAQKLIENVYKIESSSIYEPADICELEVGSAEEVLAQSDRVFEACPQVCPDEFVRFFSYYSGTLRLQRHLCSTLEEPATDVVQEQFERRIVNLVGITRSLEACLDANRE